MPKAKQRFTYTRWLDSGGNEITEDKANEQIADEDTANPHPEHVNVEPGDEVDLPKGQQGGLSGFLQDEEPTEESKPKSVAKS